MKCRLGVLHCLKYRDTGLRPCYTRKLPRDKLEPGARTVEDPLTISAQRGSDQSIISRKAIIPSSQQPHPLHLNYEPPLSMRGGGRLYTCLVVLRTKVRSRCPLVILFSKYMRINRLCPLIGFGDTSQGQYLISAIFGPVQGPGTFLKIWKRQ